MDQINTCDDWHNALNGSYVLLFETGVAGTGVTGGGVVGGLEGPAMAPLSLENGGCGG